MEKVALITGAATGIGKEITKKLANENYKVIACYNKSEEAAKKLKQELLNKNMDIDIYKVNLCNKDEIKKLAQYVKKQYGRIDVLINNAGISQIKLFTDITDEDWENMISTNLSSVFYLTREILPNMIHQKSGSIINISSVWGITGSSCEVHYSASKARNNWHDKSFSKRTWAI